MWESSSHWKGNILKESLIAEVPKKVLECEAVSREINFSSKELINNFNLKQRVFIYGTCVEGKPVHIPP